MGDPKKVLVRTTGDAEVPEFAFEHPLNPDSEIHIRPLSMLTGLSRISVSLGRVPPGRESFVYHQHHHEEEFLYILSGRAVAEVEDEEFEVGPGDFLGFPTPSVAHHLRNPFEEEVVYLMGGEHRDFEVGVFPRLKKRLIRDGDSFSIVDDADLRPLKPRGEPEKD
jgi:uncharacterized cupin superfamily protein